MVRMAKTGYINVRIDPELKGEAEEILKQLGLTVSEAVTIFFRQVVLHRGLPFEMKVGKEGKKRAL